LSDSKYVFTHFITCHEFVNNWWVLDAIQEISVHIIIIMEKTEVGLRGLYIRETEVKSHAHEEL